MADYMGGRLECFRAVNPERAENNKGRAMDSPALEEGGWHHRRPLAQRLWWVSSGP